MLKLDHSFLLHSVVLSILTFVMAMLVTFFTLKYLQLNPQEFIVLFVALSGVFTISLIISLFITNKLRSQIKYDTKQIINYLKEISNKKYSATPTTKYFNEFLHISILLMNLVKRLNKRERQKSKHTAKLRLINRQRQDILSAISHEFKNPIAAIVGYTETIKDDKDLALLMRDKFLEKILSNSNKITTMLDRLAIAVKLENNDLSIEISEFKIDDLLNDIAVNLQKKYKDRKVIVKSEQDCINADKTMIDLVITNLCDNALKYSEDNIELTYKDSLLSVVDNGIGIEAKELKNIQTKFYRVSKNSWDNSMGLGLSIVSYILKLHNTELVVQSELGSGSSFSFKLL
ncbi:MAG: sensor histidine kinase [Helicobacteraceae bacterium]|nr:sensor histidine kinase [Helicobacteraceae bacterium]